MAGVAGYEAEVKKSGTTTGFTTEATTNPSGNVWEITDATKAVWDRDVTPTFYDNGVEIAAGDIQQIDYLYGKVEFTGAKTGPITVTGSYMPMASVAGANQASLNITSAILDDTDFSNVGYHTKEYGTQDVVVSLSRWEDVQNTFGAILVARAPIVIEIAPSTAKSYRGWFIPDSVSDNFSIESLLDESVSFQLDGDDTTGKSFSISNLL